MTGFGFDRADRFSAAFALRFGFERERLPLVFPDRLPETGSAEATG